MRHVSFWPDFAISPLYFSLRLYERQSVKPARLNGCPGSFEREYYLLCSAKILWKNCEPFLKNITSNLVVSCQLLTRFRHITPLFLAAFVWTPICQTSAAKWLPRLIWKGILSTMFSESIVKKFRVVFEKYNIKLGCVMSASDQYNLFISQLPDFAISPLYFSLRLYERQSVKPARLNGCPGSFEREYYLLCSAKVLWKNFESFLKNITSNLVVSCQLLTRFRHITSLFLATFVWTPICQTSAAKWLPRLIWKGILSTMFSESIVK